MDDIRRAVQTMYDESGEYFSKTREKKYGGQSANWPVVQGYLDRVRSGDAILDLGCGNGRLLSGVPRGVKYVGIDFSRTLLAEARQKYPGRKFIFGDIAETKTWRNLGEFEAVFCIAVLHHLPTKELQIKVLKKIEEVLRDEGLLLVTVWNLWNEKLRASKLRGAKLRRGEMVQMDFNGIAGREIMAIDKVYLARLMKEANWKAAVAYVDRDGKRADRQNGENLIAVSGEVYP